LAQEGSLVLLALAYTYLSVYARVSE